MKRIIALFLMILGVMSLASCEMNFGGGTTTKSYKITYNLDGGTLPTDAVKEFTDGSKVELPIPSKEGYVFVSWQDKDGNDVTSLKGVTSNITLNAKWKEFVEGVTYTIEYVLNDGVFTDEVKYTYTSGETYEFPIPRKAGHKFIGWKEYETSEPVTGITESTTGNYKVYASWQKATIVCNITYNTNGGTLPEGIKTTYTEGTVQTFPKPVKDGYFFRGWYIDEECSEAIGSIKTTTFGDLEIYAKWVEATMENANFGILGDSISTFYSQGSSYNSIFQGNNQFYYPRYSTTVKSATQTWWYKTVKALGGNILVNNSYSGGTVVGGGMSAAVTTERLSKFNVGGVSPDIIIIYLGINDSGVYTSEKFVEEYQVMIDKINRMYSGTQIFMCTLPYVTLEGREPIRIEYNNAIVELAEKNNIPVIHFENAWSSATEQKDNWNFLGDNVHPSAAGMTVLAELAISDIKKFYGIE